MFRKDIHDFIIELKKKHAFIFYLFLKFFQKFIYFLFLCHKNITVLNTDLIE